MEEKAEQVGVVMRPPRMSNKHADFVVLAGQAAEAEQQFAIARLHPGILL
jgi:hypothetical protein